jgi:hypothetical protein
MPLLDHFHPPLSTERRWESFHTSWGTRIADAPAQRWLPPNYIAEEHAHFGPSLEIDVGTFARETQVNGAEESGAVATIGPKVGAAPVADGVLSAVFPDTFEIRVLCMDTGPTLVAAIELISPGNKDRPAERKAFAIKCASYLYQGISVIIVDIVTNRRANLHNEIVRLMDGANGLQFPPDSSLYAVAYRPLRRDKEDAIDVYRSPLTLGRALPTLPLGLRADLVVLVDFEETYAEACLRKRLTGS